MAVFDFSPLGQVGNNFVNAYDSGRKELLDDERRRALAGINLGGASPDYTTAAQKLIAAGDPHTGLAFLALGERSRERQASEMQGQRLNAGVFGGGLGAGAPGRSISDLGKTSDPVAPDLKPQEIALLNGISTGESAGAYDVRYTPQGGTKFVNNGQHPNIPEQGPEGPSTAAGRYQFVKRTWDSLPPEAKGDGSFSPENQDRAALFLARRDYKSRTGQDLDADLQREGFSPRIQQALAPTWSALKGDNQRFADVYSRSMAGNAAAGAGGVYDDPTVPDRGAGSALAYKSPSSATADAARVAQEGGPRMVLSAESPLGAPPAEAAPAAADMPAQGARPVEMTTLATGEQIPKQYVTPRLVNLANALAANPKAPDAVKGPIMKLYDKELARIDALDKERRDADAKAPKEKMEGEEKLRTEFTKRIGNFNEVHDAYGRVVSSIQQREADPRNVSPASDIGLIFGYMKMLDPGSVVREGEFATAQNSGGIQEKVVNAYNKALRGEFLTPEQRQDFGQSAKRLYDTQRKRADQYADRYGRLADGYKLDRSNVVDLPPSIDMPRVGAARTTEGSMIPGLPRNVDQPPATRPAGKTSGGVSWSIE